MTGGTFGDKLRVLFYLMLPVVHNGVTFLCSPFVGLSWVGDGYGCAR